MRREVAEDVQERDPVPTGLDAHMHMHPEVVFVSRDPAVPLDDAAVVRPPCTAARPMG